MSTFPVPPDVRGARDFRITKGMDDIIRTDRKVASAVVALIKQGEWVHLNGTAEVVKAAGETPAAPMAGASVNWTRYKKGDVNDGQADAAGNQGVTLVSGAYKADTKLFDPAGSYNPGDTLVVVDDGAGNGVLYGIAAPNALQLARAVGKVDTGIVVAGILSFNSIGIA
jgi:hypothetical protein